MLEIEGKTAVRTDSGECLLFDVSPSEFADAVADAENKGRGFVWATLLGIDGDESEATDEYYVSRARIVAFGAPVGI
jgi:hypothetical protein